jgi:YfiH family protein
MAFDGGVLREASTIAQRLEELVGGRRRVVRAKQVHSSIVLPATLIRPGVMPDADGLFASDADLAPAVMTADCVPIALYAPSESLVGVLHAGWRGIVSGVIREGVRAMRRQGASSLYAMVGPHICVACYEFKGEAEPVARSVLGDECFQEDHLDLSYAVARDLDEQGVVREPSFGMCTRESPTLPSYRGGDVSERLIMAVAQRS